MSRDKARILYLIILWHFPTGEYVVTLIDYYSRWAEEKIMKSKKSTKILAWLDQVFATHRYPRQIKSDNASYFKSTEFYTRIKSLGITEKYIKECWPQANGLVERFNKVLLKHIQTSLIEGKDWWKTLPIYRTTPYRTTGDTSSKLLMQRELRTKIPSQVINTPFNIAMTLLSQKRTNNQRERNMLMYNDMPRKRTFNQEIMS